MNNALCEIQERKYCMQAGVAEKTICLYLRGTQFAPQLHYSYPNVCDFPQSCQRLYL